MMTFARSLALGLALVAGAATVTPAFAATTRGNPGPSSANTPSGDRSSTRECDVIARCPPRVIHLAPVQQSHCKTWDLVEINGTILRECRKFSDEG